MPPPLRGSGYTDDENNSDDDEPGLVSAAARRNATLIKVGLGLKSSSTPTKLPPGIIMTAVPAASVQNPTRLVCLPPNSTVTSTVTPKPGGGGVVIIKKGNKIDLVHGTTPLTKKAKPIVPKLTKQVKLSCIVICPPIGL